CVRRYHHQR
ncbi:putative calcium-binding outer membrane-like protein, partial [Vibrio parahaemolyticus 861]